MTWNGLCSHCGSRHFVLTLNSRDAVAVNCAEPKCMAYVGRIEPEHVYQMPRAEEH